MRRSRGTPGRSTYSPRAGAIFTLRRRLRRRRRRLRRRAAGKEKAQARRGRASASTAGARTRAWRRRGSTTGGARRRRTKPRAGRRMPARRPGSPPTRGPRAKTVRRTGPALPPRTPPATRRARSASSRDWRRRCTSPRGRWPRSPSAGASSASAPRWRRVLFLSAEKGAPAVKGRGREPPVPGSTPTRLLLLRGPRGPTTRDSRLGSSARSTGSRRRSVRTRRGGSARSGLWSRSALSSTSRGSTTAGPRRAESAGRRGGGVDYVFGRRDFGR